MTITLNSDYDVTLSTALLGYVGETNARPVSIEGLTVDGADRYVLTIDYGDGVTYEVDITGGTWTPTADILRSAQTVSCQIAAKKLSGDEYILVKKSRIFRLRIGAAIGDTAVPSPDVAMDALDRISAIGEQVEADVARAENAASTAMQAAETLVSKADSAEKSAQRAEQARDTAVSAESTATQAMETAVNSADTAQKSADTAVKSADSAQAASKTAVTSAEQAHADMQTAVTAAETATTSAENAEKSATAAEKAADTATQAASRAETAKTAAETSATQAETAMQGAENARQQAVTAQNAAKISADIAAAAEQQTEADKTITAGYAKTAKTNADSTTADKQAVQTLAEQVTADKATVADHATQVAEDRAAAETAAQTAQAVADSLPDDYVTAVEKIAENTAEISAVKLTDKELQRRVDALFDMGQGITHRFETDSETAYAKTVPTGGKLMSVKNIGGRSLVWNQLVDSNIVISETTKYSFNGQHLTTNITDGLSLSDDLCALPTIPVGHKVLIKIKFIAGNVGNKIVTIGGYHNTANISWQCKINLPRNTELAGKTLIAMDTTTDTAENIRLFFFNSTIPLLTNIDCYINYYDLTVMFGSGNEPSTVEEFEKIFPADYYPYNAGEIVSAGTEEVAVGDTAYQIPEAIRNLPGYGWSAGTARNYVDYENKKYYQCVQSVDLGTGTWIAGSGGKVNFQTSLVKGQKLTKNYNIAPNFMCSKYSTKAQAELWDKHNVTGITANASNDGYIYVNDTSYTDVATFTQAMSGVMLYYELETPIVTDISNLIPDDFLRNIEVEAGGSVTFKNGNDSYRIPVPSEEEYVVKLSEVGGTT